MVSQPETWHWVGSANVEENHAAVGAENTPSAGCIRAEESPSEVEPAIRGHYYCPGVTPAAPQTAGRDTDAAAGARQRSG